MTVTPTTIPDRVDRAKQRRAWWIEQLATQGSLVAFVLWILFLCVATTTFATPDNVMIVLRQAAIYSIVAIGITMVMLLGELDISFGSALAIGGCAGAAVLIAGHGLFLAVLAAVGVGLVFGMVNALLITYLRIPSVVATLATLGAGAGVALLATGGSTLYGPGLNDIAFLTQGYVAGIPVPVIIAVVMYLIAWFVLGDSATAAFRSGINVKRLRITVFVIAGGLAGFAGLLLASRLGRASADMGADALFPVLTAVILGGVSIEGGRGRILNTLIASVFLASITNGLILLGVDSTVQQIVQGGVLVLAVSLDRLRR
jgi:ribose transport system permease protein